jgi:hypothetical protein
MDPMKIWAALEARRVELADAATTEELAQFEAQLGLKLDSELRQFYLSFDGFPSYDRSSQMALWSLKRMAQEQSLSCAKKSERYFAVGDFLIDSDFLMCCLTDASFPVFLLYEGRELAASFAEFLEKLVRGDFDFLKQRTRN